MHLTEASKFPLDRYPNLQRWMKEQIEVLPSWKKTQPAVEKALLPNKNLDTQQNLIVLWYEQRIAHQAWLIFD
jgi:hypothetical protein